MELSPEELLAAGQLDEALAQVSTRIRARPDDTGARALLFTVLCCRGEMDRAHQQIAVWAAIEPSAMPGLVAYERLLALERTRQKVLFGELPPPLKEDANAPERCQAEVLRLSCAGQQVEAARLFAQRGYCEVPGTRDGYAFRGIEDFDARFGLLLEVFLPEGYYLVPLSRVQSLGADPPKTFLDSIWRPVAIQLGDAVTPAYLPVRYPGSERSADPLVRMGRKTLCAEPQPGFYVGTGQHFWLTREPEGDFSALDFASVHLGPPAATTPAVCSTLA
jgi:type VI secretion system protein ImpE